MKTDPVPDDWSLLVQQDMSDMNLKYTDQDIRNMNPLVYKKIIKDTVRAQSFKNFKELQANHEKGRKIIHMDHTNPKDYLKTNKLTNKQTALLFNLRCNSVRGIRANFSNQFHGDLQCRLCKKEQDNQFHITQFTELRKHIQVNNEVKYDHISGTLDQQIPITLLISSLLEVRERLLEGERAYRGTVVPDQ